MNLYTFVVRMLGALDLAFGGRSQVSLDVLAVAIATNVNNGTLGTLGSFKDICGCIFTLFYDGYDDDWDEKKYQNLYRDFEGMVKNHLNKFGINESDLPSSWYEPVYYTPVRWHINPESQFSSGIGEFIVRRSCADNMIRYYLVDNTKENVYIKEIDEARANWHIDKFNQEYETKTDWYIGYPDNCKPVYGPY